MSVSKTAGLSSILSCYANFYMVEILREYNTSDGNSDNVFSYGGKSWSPNLFFTMNSKDREKFYIIAIVILAFVLLVVAAKKKEKIIINLQPATAKTVPDFSDIWPKK